MRGALRVASLALSLLAALGCTRDNDVELRIDVGPVPGVGSIRMELHDGARCDAFLEGGARPAPRFTASGAVGAALPRFPGVPEGIYSVFVEGLDGDGCVLGVGCGASRLPNPQGVRVRLGTRPDHGCSPTGLDAGPPPGCLGSEECSSGEICCEGVCAPPSRCACDDARPCDGPFECCDGVCQTSDVPCGAQVCADGEVCVGPESRCCEGRCADTGGAACPDVGCDCDGACCGGACCDAGQSCCGAECTALAVDPGSCGVCDAACTGRASACVAGRCHYRLPWEPGTEPPPLTDGRSWRAAVVYLPSSRSADAVVGPLSDGGVLEPPAEPPIEVRLCASCLADPTACSCVDESDTFALGGVALFAATADLPRGPVADLPIGAWSPVVAAWRAVPGRFPLEAFGDRLVPAGHTLFQLDDAGRLFPLEEGVRFGDVCVPGDGACAPEPPSVR